MPCTVQRGTYPVSYTHLYLALIEQKAKLESGNGLLPVAVREEDIGGFSAQCQGGGDETLSLIHISAQGFYKFAPVHNPYDLPGPACNDFLPEQSAAPALNGCLLYTSRCV